VARKTETSAVSAMFFSNPDYSKVAMIYDISCTGMHLWVV